MLKVTGLHYTLYYQTGSHVTSIVKVFVSSVAEDFSSLHVTDVNRNVEEAYLRGPTEGGSEVDNAAIIV